MALKIARDSELLIIFALSIHLLRINALPQDHILSISTALSQSREISGSLPSQLNSPKVHTDEIYTNESKIGGAWDGQIRRCPQNDPDALNKCLRLILGDLKPHLSSGIPELNLPPMDPLQLKTVNFRHGSGPIRLVTTFRNVEATGLSGYDRSDFTVGLEKRTLAFDMGIPQMTIIGNYELTGNLFIFPIAGTGNFWLSLVGISARGRGDLKVVQTNGKRRLQLQSVDLDLRIQGMKAHLTNLFNGDKLLGRVMNNFLNENSMEIFTELRPRIARRIGEIVKTVANKALSALPSDYFQDLPE